MTSIVSTSLPSYWQQAWNEAEPRLRAFTDSWEPTSIRARIPRVGQLDAELLDEELVQVLQEPLTKAFSALSTAFRAKLEPELILIIRLILYKLSIWNLGATYGAKLQDLRYQVENSGRLPLAPSGLPKRTLVTHAALTILLPFLHDRIRSHALSQAWPDTPSSDRRRKAWNMISRLESIHATAALCNFILFLWNGRYRTLADRLLSMRLVPSRRLSNRQVSYEFMNRQMVWHAFTEFLLLILPLLHSRAFRRSFNQLLARLRNFQLSSLFPSSRPSPKISAPQVKEKGRFFSLSDDQCAICAENSSSFVSGGTTDPFNTYVESAIYANAQTAKTSEEVEADTEDEEVPRFPITVPYSASCGHIYCYLCLTERLIRAIDDGDEGWECLRCKELVRSCERAQASFDDDSGRASDEWNSDDDLPSFASDMSLDSGPDRLT